MPTFRWWGMFRVVATVVQLLVHIGHSLFVNGVRFGPVLCLLVRKFWVRSGAVWLVCIVGSKVLSFLLGAKGFVPSSRGTANVVAHGAAAGVQPGKRASSMLLPKGLVQKRLWN